MRVRWWILAIWAISLVGCKKVREWTDKKSGESDAKRSGSTFGEKIRSEPALDGPGIEPGSYRVTALELRVDDVPRKGKTWDSDPESGPDVKATIMTGGASLPGQADARAPSKAGTYVATCRGKDEQVALTCTLDAHFVVDATTQLAVLVEDNDAVADDAIGRAILTQPSKWRLGTAMPMTTTDNVIGASITIDRGWTWWQVHRAKLLGLLAGAVLAVSGLLAFRTQLFPPPPPPRVDDGPPLPAGATDEELRLDQERRIAAASALRDQHDEHREWSDPTVVIAMVANVTMIVLGAWNWLGGATAAAVAGFWALGGIVIALPAARMIVRQRVGWREVFAITLAIVTLGVSVVFPAAFVLLIVVLLLGGLG